jgi:hypothetical protein
VARYETAIPGLNALLRDLRNLPKEAQAELRTASLEIADRHMVPAYRAAALGAGPWGVKLQGAIKARRDRVPVVVIGARRKVFSGGATAIMVRFPSHAGRVRNSIPAAFDRTGWLDRAGTAYRPAALQEWGSAVSTIVRDFNRGGVKYGAGS